MPTVTRLEGGYHCIDLEFQGRQGVVAVYQLEDDGERALIEVGPTSTLDTLLAALQSVDVQPETISKVLVTHIHLDHAGAAGTFLRRFPRAHLFVHERGAPHLIDPSRLLSSATRIYGEMMDTLWGPVEPVPQERLTVLRDGDVVTIGRREITALYTPGHASHHVAYHDPAYRSVFAGDVAAVRLQGIQHVRPPTPPPDIDLELWSDSLDRLRELDARVLYLTHFGPSTRVRWHLEETRKRLYAWAEFVEQRLQQREESSQIAEAIRNQENVELRQLTDDPAILERYELGAFIGMSVDGLIRYLTKRRAAQPSI